MSDATAAARHRTRQVPILYETDDKSSSVEQDFEQVSNRSEKTILVVGDRQISISSFGFLLPSTQVNCIVRGPKLCWTLDAANGIHCDGGRVLYRYLKGGTKYRVHPGAQGSVGYDRVVGCKMPCPNFAIPGTSVGTGICHRLVGLYYVLYLTHPCLVTYDPTVRNTSIAVVA